MSACRWTPPCEECGTPASKTKPRYSIENVVGRLMCRECRDRAAAVEMDADPATDAAPQCPCMNPTSMKHLPPLGACQGCFTGEARQRLLSHSRANRSCPVCHEPLPVAAIHLEVHADCGEAGRRAA